MRSSTVLLTLAASFLELASGHGFINGVRVNGGTWVPGADPVWYYYTAGTSPKTVGWNSLNQDLGFVQPSAFGTSDIACHKSATAGQLYISANAGDTLSLTWNTWPSDSHKGPLINYLAQCSGECTSASASALTWTKIAENGYNSGTWATDPLPTSNYTSTVKIPSKLKAGNYVLRHEIIALHGAGSDNGAQNYPQCLNIKVGGSGTVSLPTGTAGTSLYTRTDPGILFNLYTTFTSYTIPGPALWTGAN
ncbi:glycoside hydrolase [Truncatella angustata]|uniref:lytic cellulose monooxygenase (C4-dehydrogenating) n=1 Tax=Truncatella angustata TaxID=152316 RepID=A0A9P8UFW1_9PEZI|nr:glycoside hydrolase [Truncatella angustata]KAH6651459.1 glycoside hydrolase [Truncatella angustata]